MSERMNTCYVLLQHLAIASTTTLLLPSTDVVQNMSLLQVGSWLIGGASILKTAAEQKGVIEHYVQMVNELQDPNLSSK